jgi:hypothetical protein
MVLGFKTLKPQNPLLYDVQDKKRYRMAAENRPSPDAAQRSD